MIEMELFERYENCFLLDACAMTDIARDYQPYKEHSDNLDKMIVKQILEKAIIEGKILIHTEVEDEINIGYNKEHDTGLFLEFCKTKKVNCILSPEESYSLVVQNEIKAIYAQASYTHQGFKRYNNTLHADPWLIAFAKHHKCTIVTNEADKDWRIPWICRKNNILCVNSTSFLSTLRNKYILPK